MVFCLHSRPCECTRAAAEVPPPQCWLAHLMASQLRIAPTKKKRGTWNSGRPFSHPIRRFQIRRNPYPPPRRTLPDHVSEVVEAELLGLREQTPLSAETFTFRPTQFITGTSCPDLLRPTWAYTLRRPRPSRIPRIGAAGHSTRLAALRPESALFENTAFSRHLSETAACGSAQSVSGTINRPYEVFEGLGQGLSNKAAPAKWGR